MRRRPLWPYQWASHSVEGMIVVTRDLEQWAIRKLHRPAERVRYIPNFVVGGVRVGRSPDLPGVPGKRLVCVANFKLAKDHRTLIRAMSEVVQSVGDAHLLLVGDSSTETADQVKAEIDHFGLNHMLPCWGSAVTYMRFCEHVMSGF